MPFKVDFVAICVVLPLSAARTRVLDSRICRYLRGSPLVWKSGNILGEQILSLFMWFSPGLQVWDCTWRADLVAIYMVLLLCASRKRGLDGRFCRYLRGSPLVCNASLGICLESSVQATRAKFQPLRLNSSLQNF